jgi:hypothetical protein
MLRKNNPGEAAVPSNRCASVEGDQVARAKAGGAQKYCRD